METDAAILLASLSEPERFGEIFDRHYRPVWGYMAKVAGPQLADDLAGQVFLSAFESRHRFDTEQGSVRAWLYGIASNLVRTRFRTDRRARQALRRLSIDRGGADRIELVVEADALRAEAVRVRRAMNDLGFDDRHIIVLAAWEGLTYPEIASILGVPVGTVRSRLSRARSRLRELLSECGEVPDRPFRGAAQ